MKRCRLVTEQVSQEDMEIHGEFLTLEEMEERKFSGLLGPFLNQALIPFILCSHLPFTCCYLRVKIAGILAYCEKYPYLKRQAAMRKGAV